jgi:DNA gyrase subunit A
MLVVGGGDILTITENGFGKRTRADDYPRQGRGGQGLIGISTSDRNGMLVGAKQVDGDDDVMLISDGGTLVRTCASEISTLGRNTQGVTLIRLREGEKLVGLARIETEDKAESTTGIAAEMAIEAEAEDGEAD